MTNQTVADGRPRFLYIKKFWDFQHYHTRGAPWIKLYAALLDDPEFMHMTEAAQAQLMKLWLLASQFGHPLPNNPRLLAGKIGSTGRFHLQTMIDAGFLIQSNDPASKTDSKNASKRASKNASKPDSTSASTSGARSTSDASTPPRTDARVPESSELRGENSEDQKSESEKPDGTPAPDDPQAVSFEQLAAALEAALGERDFAIVLEFLRRRPHRTWPGWAREMLKLIGPGSQYTAPDLAIVCADDAALETPIGSPYALRSFLGTTRRERINGAHVGTPAGERPRTMPTERRELGEATYAAALAATADFGPVPIPEEPAR